jgi:hypothetical protein
MGLPVSSTHGHLRRFIAGLLPGLFATGGLWKAKGKPPKAGILYHVFIPD